MQIESSVKIKNMVILLSESDIRARIKTLAQEINESYSTNETLVVLIVLNGALVFAADLIRYFEMPIEIESIRIKSYIGVQSSGCVELLSPLPQSLINQNVLIVEDIIDSGRSIQFLMKCLEEHKVKSVRICTLLNKPQDHLVPIQPDYVGFNIGKNFVVGYGLDLDGKYRNLPYIAEIIG